MINWKALLLAGCLLLTGCSPKPQRHYEVRTDLGICFRNADAVIEAIRAGLLRRDRQITVSYSAGQDHLQVLGTLVSELMECAVAETESPQEGDYLRYNMGGYTMQSSYRTANGQFFYEITILPQYYTTAAEEQLVTERVQQILNTLNFDAQTADVQKVQLVTSYICDHVRYDKIHAKNPQHHAKATAYAALIQGQAVCQGYAAAVYRLLREAGIPVRIVTGTAGEREEFHAWNLVCIDGLYYNLDVTWDDANGNTACFLKSDADFEGHLRDAAFSSPAFYAAYPMAETSCLPDGKDGF